MEVSDELNIHLTGVAHVKMRFFAGRLWGWKDLGAVLAILGDLPSAEEAFKKALALDPSSTDIRFQLAAIRPEAASEADSIARSQGGEHSNRTCRADRNPVHARSPGGQDRCLCASVRICRASQRTATRHTSRRRLRL